MGAFEAIIVLAIVGFLLIATEVFVPGMVLGTLGGLCLIGAVVVSYAGYGMLTGTLVLAGVFTATLAGFIVWMFTFPHTPIGRKIMLQKQLARGGGISGAPDSLIGQEGTALTPLRPAGKAAIGERKVDVVAESDFIAEGTPVLVVGGDGMRVIVRKRL